MHQTTSEQSYREVRLGRAREQLDLMRIARGAGNPHGVERQIATCLNCACPSRADTARTPPESVQPAGRRISTSIFDVVVASNLFGDILSDLGPACTGTIGIAPSGNINPERSFPSLFEPVHGSAPDIAGKGIANPVGQIWAAAMMLDHLGHPEAGKAILSAIETVLSEERLRTRDLGGSADTVSSGKAIADAIV